jgi:hypothetical protein
VRGIDVDPDQLAEEDKTVDAVEMAETDDFLDSGDDDSDDE